jgi:hypothetical protein
MRHHHRRRNHSDYMRGRTPAEILDTTIPQSIMTTSHRDHTTCHLNPPVREGLTSLYETGHREVLRTLWCCALVR